MGGRSVSHKVTNSNKRIHILPPGLKVILCAVPYRMGGQGRIVSVSVTPLYGTDLGSPKATVKGDTLLNNSGEAFASQFYSLSQQD